MGAGDNGWALLSVSLELRVHLWSFLPGQLAALWSALANPEAQKSLSLIQRGAEGGRASCSVCFAEFGVLSECHVWMETNELKTISEGAKVDTCYSKASSLRK